MTDVLFTLGVLVVFLVAFQRFNSIPPSKPSLPEGIPRPLGQLLSWFSMKREPRSALFPPPRANTTVFKFWLFRTVYGAIAALAYAVIYKSPELAQQIQQIVYAGSKEVVVVSSSGGPIVLAFVVSGLLPMLPPFKAADEAIRRILYERASIPGQQLRERNRLKDAPYVADASALDTVRQALIADGFDAVDIVWDEHPTTRSLWTKASVLIQQVAAWRGRNEYKTAFAVLKERESDERSVDRVEAAYEALKGDAKVCFAAMRNQPGAAETGAREEAFRGECKELLGRIYDLLSRVSLQSHFSDRTRIECMAEIGFRLTSCDGGPIPDANDLVALAMVVGAALILPLSAQVGVGRALVIATVMYTAVLIPILLAHKYPRFATRHTSRTPAVAFPVVSGLIAAAIGLVVFVMWNALDLVGPGAVLDLQRGWSGFWGRSYPWSLLHALLPALIAWRMRIGAYPDTTQLAGLARYQEWGSLCDAAIFIGCSTVLGRLVILPKVAELRHDPAFGQDPTALGLIILLAGVIGFIIPTWYRAHAARAPKMAEEGQPVIMAVGALRGA
jgi:hypothetical protein